MDDSSQIQTNGVTTPQEAETAAGRLKQFPIEGQIAADRYANAAAGAKTTNRGVRFGKIIPAGPVPDQQATGLGGLQGFQGGGWF